VRHPFPLARKASRSASSDVKNEMHRYKRGTARSGPAGRGGKVKSRKQAIAISLSKARKKGKKVPARKGYCGVYRGASLFTWANMIEIFAACQPVASMMAAMVAPLDPRNR
jgi:Family of unknown function (DUF6496)